MKIRINAKRLAEFKRNIRLNPILGNAKIILAVLIIISFVWLLKIAGFDMMIDCDRTTGYCTISKTDGFKGKIIPLSLFQIGKVVDVLVAERTVEDGTVVYDVLLDCGPKDGKVFIDFVFNTKIKANTVKMKLSRYIETYSKTLHISKHCYFNDYFCF